MLKRNFKRLVAMLLSATMVIGSSTAAFAGTIGEAGDVEGWVNKKVFSVLVPTASANALKMLVDPQKLIASTNAVAKEGYTAADFAQDATILFPRTDAGARKFDGRSDSISMANVGTVSVNVSLTAAITGADGIALSANASAASMGATTDPTMYIEMVKENLGNMSTANGTAWNTAKAGGTPNGSDDAILLSGNNGSATKNVDLSIDKVAGVIDKYEVSHNGTNYTYGVSSDKVAAVKSAAYADGQCIKFYFTGATNNGDNIGWKSLVNAKPNLTLTYNITKADTDAEEQALAGDAVTLSSTYDEAKRVYRIIMPSGVTINSVGDVENFKFNGIDITSSLNSFATLTQAKDQIRMDKDSIKAVQALSEFWAGNTQTFTVTFTYDGVDYTSVVAR